MRRMASRAQANRDAVIESMVRVGPVMIVAGLIAVITFLSLAGTGIPMVQHFGVFAGCGVLATMVIEMTLIPARALDAAPARSRVRPSANGRPAFWTDSWRRRRTTWSAAARAWIVGGGLALLALVGTGVARLRVDNNFKLYLKPDERRARSTTGSSTTPSAAPTPSSS